MTHEMATLLATIIPVVVIPLVLELRHQMTAARRIVQAQGNPSGRKKSYAKFRLVPAGLSKRALARWWADLRVWLDAELPIGGSGTSNVATFFFGIILVVLGREEFVALLAASGAQEGSFEVVLSVIFIVFGLLLVSIVPIFTEYVTSVFGENGTAKRRTGLLIAAVAGAATLLVFSPLLLL